MWYGVRVAHKSYARDAMMMLVVLRPANNIATTMVA